MTTFRRFMCDDLFSFNNVNLDRFTETYHLGFYLSYLAHWPDLCMVAQAPAGSLMVLGKAEGKGEEWHGHVTAVTVAPDYRRIGLAARLMDFLESVSEKIYDGYFVDLFVRVSNKTAITMYTKLSYIMYRQVREYYSGEEDAFDMRKALPRDVSKKSVIPVGRIVSPEEVDPT